MFQVTRTLNEWNRYGHPINVRTNVVLATTDLKAAFERARDERRALPQGATYAATATKFSVVEVATGAQVFLDRLYEMTVGPLTFAALCAADGWSINLDDWLDAGAVA